jgi:hypothetical protein
MRNLLIIFTAFLLNTACNNYSNCYEPRVSVNYYPQDTTDTIFFNFKRYVKSSNFSNLVDSVRDSFAYHKQNTPNGQLAPEYDYIIDIPETGKSYKIYNIHYDGKERVKSGGVLTTNEYRTMCSRNTYFTVNGVDSIFYGAEYQKLRSYPNNWPTINITK